MRLKKIFWPTLFAIIAGGTFITIKNSSHRHRINQCDLTRGRHTAIGFLKPTNCTSKKLYYFDNSDLSSYISDRRVDNYYSYTIKLSDKFNTVSNDRKVKIITSINPNTPGGVVRGLNKSKKMGRGPFGCIPKPPLSNSSGVYSLLYFTTTSPTKYYVPIGTVNHAWTRRYLLQDLKGRYFVTNSLDTIQRIETFINSSTDKSNCELGLETEAITDNTIDQKVYTKIKIFDGNRSSIVVGI